MNIRRSIIISAIVSAILLTGCSAPDEAQSGTSPAPATNAESTGSTEHEASSAVTSIQSSPASASKAAESTEPVTAEFPYANWTISGEHVIDQPQMTELSPDNVLVDYDYISDIPGVTDPEECRRAADGAINAVRQCDRYAELVDWFADNPGYAEKKIYSDVAETVGDWLKDGEPGIEFVAAYINDYDGNGTEEAFVVVRTMLLTEYPWCYVIYVDSDGNAAPYEQWNSIINLESVDLLDYGRDKQIVFNAYGTMGANTHSPLLGVRDGKMVTHYDFRGGYIKSDCFLMTVGWQACGEYMVYDTAEHEYRTIIGKEVSIDELYAMDSTGILPEREDVFIPQAQVIGNKFYALGASHFIGGVYFFTYENGAFVEVYDPYKAEETRFDELINIRISDYPTKNTLYIEDYDKALASMVTPEQAAKLLGSE